MPFKPAETQARILQALEHVEFHGCQAARVTGKPGRLKYTFGYGVPGIVLMAWVQVAESRELTAEMRPPIDAACCGVNHSSVGRRCRLDF